jgi:hypothetical protein
MMLSRLLASTEPLKQRFQAIAEADSIRRYRQRIDADFEAYTHSSMLNAAEAAYAVLSPYQPPQLPGDTLDDITTPTDKVTGAEVEQLPLYTPVDTAISSPPTAQNQLHPSEQTAMHTLQALARADSSTALVAAPGSGKSVTLNYLIQEILTQSPNAEIWVVSAKNDSFCGLRERNRVIVFDPDDPDETKDTINNFYLTYKERKSLPEHKRQALPPLILILDDWLVVADQLQKLYPDWDYGGKLLDVLLIGREFNTKFIASLQSFNLGALGIQKVDAQTRLCLNLLLLGNHYVKQGRKQESYGVLELILNRGDIIPLKQEREAIKAKYNELKPISYQNFRPVMIASMGGFVVALMPKLDKSIAPQPNDRDRTSPQVTDKSYLERVFNLEFNLGSNTDRTSDSELKPQLSLLAQTILEIITSATKYPISFEAIRKSRRWSQAPSKQELLSGIAELIAAEQIEGNENDGFEPCSK